MAKMPGRMNRPPAHHDATDHPVQQPADVGRKLLRFGSRKQHAVIESMAETALRYPVLLLFHRCETAYWSLVVKVGRRLSLKQGDARAKGSDLQTDRW